MHFEPFLSLKVTVGPAVEVGATPCGLRRVIPILGGEGSLASGEAFKVLPVGADFQLLVQENGAYTTAQLDARYVLELTSGERIYVHNTALRHADAAATQALLRGEPVTADKVYFRCQPRFETATPRLQWLHTRQFVGQGVRLPDRVELDFFVVV